MPGLTDTFEMLNTFHDLRIVDIESQTEQRTVYTYKKNIFKIRFKLFCNERKINKRETVHPLTI